MNIQILDRLRRAASAFQESSVLAAAAELDLFTEILKQGNRAAATTLAGSAGVDLRGCTVLLDVLTATEYLLKSGRGDEATYSVAEPYKELLDSRTPETFIPMIRHMACCQRSWTDLARTVKEGKPQKRPASILGEEQDYRSFIWAMNSIARTLVGPTVESLKAAEVLSFKNFIDIGGASGTYTQAFLQALPTSTGTLFDLPPGVAAARQRFTGSEFESRVTLIEGNFYTDEFPGGFDFAWISAIIHQHGMPETQSLFAKTFRALNSGGRIAVRDFVMNSDRTQPKDGAYFGVNMLANTATGMVYTLDEIRAALEAAGFAGVRLAVPADTMSAVVVAVKP